MLLRSPLCGALSAARIRAPDAALDCERSTGAVVQRSRPSSLDKRKLMCATSTTTSNLGRPPICGDYCGPIYCLSTALRRGAALTICRPMPKSGAANASHVIVDVITSTTHHCGISGSLRHTCQRSRCHMLGYVMCPSVQQRVCHLRVGESAFTWQVEYCGMVVPVLHYRRLPHRSPLLQSNEAVARMRRLRWVLTERCPLSPRH